MVHLGMADGIVSGATHTTAHTIVPSFQIIKTAPGTATASSVFLMGLSDRVLRLGDYAVNPDPTAEHLAGIAIQARQRAGTPGGAPQATSRGCTLPAFSSHRRAARVPCTQMRGTT